MTATPKFTLSVLLRLNENSEMIKGMSNEEICSEIAKFVIIDKDCPLIKSGAVEIIESDVEEFEV